MNDAPSESRAWLALAAVTAVGVGLRLLLSVAHTTMEADEFAYARMAQDLVGAPPGGQPLSQPILLPCLLAALHHLGLGWEWAGRAVSLTSSLLLLPAVAGLGRAVFGSWTPGLVAALVVALYPLEVDLGSRVATEPLYHLLLVLACWQAWRASVAPDRELYLQSTLAGLAVGMASLARREGRFYLLALAVFLLLAVTRRRGLVAAGLLSGTGTALLLASGLLVEQGRPAPGWTMSTARLAQLLAPLLAPALLFLTAPRQPEDGRRRLFFAAILAALPLIAIFPDPGRKATALVPFLALLSAEGARRWGVPTLAAAVVVWYLAQGLSGPMMPYLVPPWTDRADAREAGEWLAPRLRPGERVGAWDAAAPYYASARWWRPRARDEASLEALLRACRTKGVRYVVVDRRSLSRSRPLVDDLGRDPRSRPGLRLVRIVPLRLSPLNELLSSPLRHRGLHPDEKAVIYRVKGP